MPNKIATWARKKTYYTIRPFRNKRKKYKNIKKLIISKKK